MVKKREFDVKKMENKCLVVRDACCISRATASYKLLTRMMPE